MELRYFNELTNMALLTRRWVKWRGSSPAGTATSEKDSDKGKDLGEEMADVLVGLTGHCEPDRRESYRSISKEP